MESGHGGKARFRAALTGHVLDPPARGATFIDPALLAEAVALGPARALALAAARARLDLLFVPSWEPWAEELLALLRAEAIAALWVAPGVLTPVLESLGHAEGLRATARDPASLATLLGAAESAMLASVRAGARLGADAVVVADDLAAEGGLLVTPAFALAEVVPRLARAAVAAAEGGVPALLHTDGDVSLLLAGVRAAGFAGMHLGISAAGAFEALFAAARREGLVVAGGIPTRALDAGPLAAIAEGARTATLARNGGLLLADDGGISSARQYESLLAALGAAGSAHR